MKPTISPDGASWTLPTSVKSWIDSLPIEVATSLSCAVEEFDLDGSARVLELNSPAIARFSEPVALAVGLPSNNRLSFDIRLSGALGKPGATLGVRWLQPGKTVPAKGVICSGCWVEWEGNTYRVPGPVYSALQLVNDFNACSSADTEEQFRVWAHIRAALGDSQSDALTDHFLRSFRVVTASAFTLGIVTDAKGDIQIEPILLTQVAGDGGVVEQVRALTEADETLFARRLDELRPNAPAFPMNQGLYVVVEPKMQEALSAIRELRRASPERRKQAALHPEAVIREILKQSDDAPTLFVETERFAERVLDVSEWVAPILPWIKIAPQGWAPPVGFGVRINGVEVPLNGAQLESACTAMRAALPKGLPEIEIDGKKLPVGQANLAALEQLKRSVEVRSNPEPPTGAVEAPESKVLVIETNFDNATYSQVKVNARPGVPGLPGIVKTLPKRHQEDGIRWLQAHWTSGSRGAMLCDDMGLGKTYQALAFCAWLGELMDRREIPRRPILLIAPVGLLRTWENEQDAHLMSPGLGNLLRAYGENLKQIKRGRHADGTAGLDTARLGAADVVLANYEAVSDYQLSFGAIQFAAVILDEAQKVKSPKARMTHAVKALNTDFMVAMTGTPVENRLADLWCISDAVQPGALGDLKSFSAMYESDTGAVKSLRDSIWQTEDAIDTKPKMLLRRLKSEKLDGLPEKLEHVIKRPMPQRQLEAYSRALAVKELQGPGGTLGMIQALRSISLHPVLSEGKNAAGGDLRIEDSARFIAALDTLDAISKTGEKALVFLESLDLQAVDQLPVLLQRRYGLARLPMVINGEVSTEKRQDRVNLFQRSLGFDVMLLSPKAGGVGLTLTAANHVIHLSRWWNPAVEDQCSDRVYRIGQEKTVHIYYPMAVLPDAEEHSFDMQLQVLMERKRALARNLLASSAFTKQDYEELMKGTRVDSDASRAV